MDRAKQYTEAGSALKQHYLYYRTQQRASRKRTEAGAAGREAI